MLKVEDTSQWMANTVSFEDVEPLYLRLYSDTHAIWYVLSDDYKGMDAWVWVEDTKELEDAWLMRE
jgi:hypothetical protein